MLLSHRCALVRCLCQWRRGAGGEQAAGKTAAPDVWGGEQLEWGSSGWEERVRRPESSPSKVLREHAFPKRKEQAFVPESNLSSKFLFLSFSPPFSWPTTPTPSLPGLTPALTTSLPNTGCIWRKVMDKETS